jgi:CRISPR-associated endoribonuclease Cas6
MIAPMTNLLSTQPDHSITPELPWQALTFTLVAQTTLELPAFTGSTLRGGFGHALQKVICIAPGRKCGQCLLRQNCLYYRIFESREGAARNAPARPYVIVAPLTEEGRHLSPGERFAFEMVLFGEAITAIPYIIYTFIELGSIGIGRGRGKFKVQEVSVDSNVIFREGSDTLLGELKAHSLQGFWAAAGMLTSPLTEITIRLLTPLRFKHENHYADQLNFEIFLRTLLRRIITLINQYGHGAEQIDFKSLIESAQMVNIVENRTHWIDIDRYSQRQQQKMQIGGVLGSICFAGPDLRPFMPYIRMGERFHIGKNTGFGLGRIAVDMGGMDQGEKWGMEEK